jgi:pimeloyl-ACP methyl ester carboxylesterase
MAVFILVPGSWHGAWCWERVIPLLESRGHRALAVELVGTGSDQTPILEASLDRWTDQVVDLAAAQTEKVVLVGHSRGGLVISAAAERAPSLIAQLIYVTSALAKSGESLFDVFTAVQYERLPDSTYQVSQEGVMTLNADAAGDFLYNKTDTKWRNRAESLLGSELFSVYMTPLHLTNDRFGQIPRAYVKTLRDRVFSVEFQTSMHQRVPCEQVITLDCDHSPWYSAPDALANALDSVWDSGDPPSV